MSEQGDSSTVIEAGRISGEESFEAVTRLDAHLSNGTVSITEQDLEPGTVTVKWEITEKDDQPFCGKAEDLELIFSNDDGKLSITDEYHKTMHRNPPKLEVWIAVAPDIPVKGMLGNGKLDLNVSRIEGATLGNGKLHVAGTLADDANLEVGNGKVSGEVLITGGDHCAAVGNGSIKLKLLEGSSCDIKASVSIGSISVDGCESSVRRHFLGCSAKGRAGDGLGDLRLNIGNGSISVDAG